MQLNLMMNVGALRGLNYIEAALKKIALTKQTVVAQIEMGNEVHIPAILSQDHLPVSFRYYDSLIRNIKINLSQPKKGYYIIKKQFAHEYHIDSMAKTIMIKLGIIEDEANSKAKQSFKVVNKKSRKEIPIHRNHYTKELQRSKFVAIDDLEAPCQH